MLNGKQDCRTLFEQRPVKLIAPRNESVPVDLHPLGR